MSFPVMPDHTLVYMWNHSMVIGAVQIRVKAGDMPPGSFEMFGTVFGPVVIILIFGRKRVTTMMGKRITSGS